MAAYRRDLATAAVGYVVAVFAACNGDPSGPSTEDFPDIAGRWNLSMTAVPAGTDGTEGTCQLDPMIVDLTRGGTVGFTEQYVGSHLGGRIECVGLTAVATASSGWRDTVIVLSPDTVSATVQRVGCFIGLPCNGPGVNASIRLTSGLVVGARANELRMTGDLLLIAEDTIRLEGSWTGVR